MPCQREARTRPGSPPGPARRRRHTAWRVRRSRDAGPPALRYTWRMVSIADLLSTGEPLPLPGVWDALSAKLAARAGFRALFVSGYCLSATRLGKPDFGLLTQTEVLDAAARICAAVDVPVIVDIDTGYGNAFNVERTIEELQRTGAAGCFLEDQVWPKRCGHMEGKRVVPVDEYLPKLRAALSTRAGTAFHVTARTDARAAAGLDEAVARARAFADTGADAVFVEAPESIDEMTRIRASVPAATTLVANMVEQGKTPIRSVTALATAGYQMTVLPVAALLTSVRALETIYSELAKTGTSTAMNDRMLPFADMNELLGLATYYTRENRWRG